ncbi:TetR/AcrR family transcriptional regulator [Actinophytocola sp. NPDC049390]|uniref:TetR/AcrR family transcriptional regulator n=1 Tax=Actinophytocola sp. NPDC049390 TaxID=3363894 RepID=UPI0037998B69
MGNREDLLAGALRCLKDKGWARTTVRDIASAAGVNHAAIGYHFGSREALLIEAFVQAMDEWGGEVETAVRAALDPSATARERYETFWRTVIESYGANRRLWLASVEAAVEAEHNPRVRELMSAALREGRSGLAAGLVGVPEDELDDTDIRSIGSVQLALMSGVLVQHLLDPDDAPRAENVTDALLSLARRLS